MRMEYERKTIIDTLRYLRLDLMEAVAVLDKDIERDSHLSKDIEREYYQMMLYKLQDDFKSINTFINLEKGE